MDPARACSAGRRSRTRQAADELFTLPDGRRRRAAPRLHRAARARRQVPRRLEATEEHSGGHLSTLRRREHRAIASSSDEMRSVVHGLRDERDRRARAPRRARRPQAGAPPRALRDAGPRPAAEPPVRQVRARGRRLHGQVPPARRLGDLRHARAPGPARSRSRYPLVDGAGQLRQHRRRPRRGHALHRVPALAASPIEMLRDLDEDVVDFEPNYDGRTQMPLVLPARFPNLLANGSAGIAVGMATNIPPHNLREIIDARRRADRQPRHHDSTSSWSTSPGPDFPTGGVIMGLAGIRDAYETGRGRIRVRAGRAHRAAEGRPRRDRHHGAARTRSARAATTACSRRSPSSCNEKVHHRDPRHRATSRTAAACGSWIELKRGEMRQGRAQQALQAHAAADDVRRQHGRLVDGAPRTLGLKALLRHYVDHQKEVVTRRTKFRLRAGASSAPHVLEGYLIALDNLDRVIAADPRLAPTPRPRARR